MHADQWVLLFWIAVVVLSYILFATMFFWLGEWYGHRHPRVKIPPRPTLCPWCRGPLRSELIWSSVCRVCNRGRVGPFPPEEETGAPFVSHADVGDRRP
jgi:hypothetical protein